MLLFEIKQPVTIRYLFLLILCPSQNKFKNLFKEIHTLFEDPSLGVAPFSCPCIPSLGCMSVTKSQSVRIAKGELHCCDFTIEGNQVTAARYVVSR